MIILENELECLFEREGVGFYRIPVDSPVHNYILSTPHTRRICNDPTCAGVEYTRLLSHACAIAFRLKPVDLVEHSTAVVNILRGGLNYGLRDALADAYGWNYHSTCFISAQRARNSVESEDWHITENRYRHTRQREPVRAENQRDTNRHPHINAKAIPKFLEEV